VICRLCSHQTAHRDIFAQDIHRGNFISGRQCDNQLPIGRHKFTGTDEQRVGTVLNEGCKGSLDFAGASDMEEFDLLPNAEAAA
jgi:hypothetical protein